MAQQAVWRVRRVTLPVPVPSLSAVRSQLWMLGPPLLLGVLAAVLAIQLGKQEFRAKSELYFNLATIRVTATNRPFAVAPYSDPSTYLASQQRVARSPELASRVIRAAQVRGLTPAEFLRHSDARPQPNSTLLTLSVSYPQPAAALRLANAYAHEFRHFKAALDMNAIKEQLQNYQVKIDALGQTKGPVYEALIQRKLDLKTLGGQFANNVSVLQPAESAAKVRPDAVRNGILGGVVGVLFGLALVVAVRHGRRQSQRSP